MMFIILVLGQWYVWQEQAALRKRKRKASETKYKGIQQEILEGENRDEGMDDDSDNAGVLDTILMV